MNNKKVIYTAIFGDYDDLFEPTYIPEGWDFVCFTDINKQSNIWKVKKIKRLNKDPKRENAHYKLLPHRFLSDYDYSIYIDGNILVRGDINELIDIYLVDSNIAMMNHALTENDPRSCVYEEANAIIKMVETNYKDDPDIVIQQINRYKKEGYPKDNGLIGGGEILRRHNAKDVIKTMEHWWNEVNNGSKRDQLSFNYSAWKTNLNFKWMEGDVRNNKYFIITSHHKKIKKNNILNKFKQFFNFTKNYAI